MLTISFPEAILMAYFAIQFMGGRPKLFEIILIGFIQAIIAFTVRTLPIPIGSHTIVLVITYIVLITIIARMRIWAASIGIITGIIILILQEIFVTQFLLKATGFAIQDVISDHYMRIYFFIPSAAVLLVIILLCKKYNITFYRITKWHAFREQYSIESTTNNNNSPVYKEYLPAVIFIFLPTFLLFILNFAYVSVQVDSSSSYYPKIFKNLFNALILSLAFISVWALRRISRSVEKEYEAKKAAETIDQLKELILSIRKQRHDFNHNLQTVYGLIETGSYESAREYIQNTYHYVSGTGELIKTDNLAISAHLYSKIASAETRNIRLDISIECSLEEFPLKSNEASSLLGNLIDNAIDAVDKNGAVDRVVRMDINAERGEYLICVANKGEIDQQVTGSIFNSNFTTKEGHAGLGLTIVKEIVDKYRGNINVSSSAGETVFRIIIPFRR